MASKHFKLYADENIESELVQHLRKDCNFTVKCSKELGHSGYQDTQILNYANKLNCFLLTYNYKDFLRDHHKFSFKNLVGIIGINKNFCPCSDLKCLASHRSVGIKGKKFLLTSKFIKVLSQDRHGRIMEEKLEIGDCPCNLKDTKK